jgi:hypothetical protein
MTSSPVAGLFVLALDKGIELPTVHAPHTAAPELDGGEVTRSDEGVGLRNADAEVRRHVVERKETGFDPWLHPVIIRGVTRPRHDGTLAKLAPLKAHLAKFTYAWCRSSGFGVA